MSTEPPVSEKKETPAFWDQQQRIYRDALPLREGRLDVAQALPKAGEEIQRLTEEGLFDLSIEVPASYGSPSPYEHWYAETRNLWHFATAACREDQLVIWKYFSISQLDCLHIWANA